MRAGNTYFLKSDSKDNRDTLSLLFGHVRIRNSWSELKGNLHHERIRKAHKIEKNVGGDKSKIFFTLCLMFQKVKSQRVQGRNLSMGEAFWRGWINYWKDFSKNRKLGYKKV